MHISIHALSVELIKTIIDHSLTINTRKVYSVKVNDTCNFQVARIPVYVKSLKWRKEAFCIWSPCYSSGLYPCIKKNIFQASICIYWRKKPTLLRARFCSADKYIYSSHEETLHQKPLLHSLWPPLTFSVLCSFAQYYKYCAVFSLKCCSETKVSFQSCQIQ